MQRGSFTYTARTTGPVVERLGRRVPRIAGPNHSLNRTSSRRADQRVRIGDTLIRVTTSAQRIVANLSTLRVHDNNKLRARTLLVESIDLVRNILRASLDGRTICAVTLSWIGDGFGGRAWVGVEDQVDEGTG